MILRQADARRDAVESRKRASAVFIWGKLEANQAETTSNLAGAHENCLATRNLLACPTWRSLADKIKKAEQRKDLCPARFLIDSLSLPRKTEQTQRI
jgi:hypothetical protein